jgi:hypothetical protein
VPRSVRGVRSQEGSSDDERVTNRARSHSNASVGNTNGKGKDKRLTLPSFGSFGKKSGLSMGMGKRKPGMGGKYGGYDGDERAALQSDEDEGEYRPSSPRMGGTTGYSSGRTRSTSTLSASHFPITSDNTVSARSGTMRRTYTSPSNLNARYVKAAFAFTGGAEDELALRVGQIVEVKSEISDDWWIGESEGKAGMFPAAYTEEYVPTPQTAMPLRRTMPPISSSGARGGHNQSQSQSQQHNDLPPSPTLDYHLTSDSEMSHGYDDADHYATASLASSAQPPPQTRERSGTIGKKPPPPPPPSRRSQSSHNILSSVTSPPTALAPPIATGRPRANTATKTFRLETSPEGSPFAGSEDDESDVYVGHDRGGQGEGANGNRGLTSGLGAVHLGQQGAGLSAEVRGCGTCGCEDFTQNVFKGKGMCSTCYHQH